MTEDNARHAAPPDRTCVYCGRAWRQGPGVWAVTWDTDPECDHETLSGLT